MNGLESDTDQMALVEELTLKLLDALNRSTPDGVCDFCLGTKLRQRKIFEHRLSGRNVTICSNCSALLKRAAFDRDRCEYFSEWLRYQYQISHTGDYGDVPPLVLAEWLSKRMLKRLSRNNERSRTKITS